MFFGNFFVHCHHSKKTTTLIPFNFLSRIFLSGRITSAEIMLCTSGKKDWYLSNRNAYICTKRIFFYSLSVSHGTLVVKVYSLWWWNIVLLGSTGNTGSLVPIIIHGFVVGRQHADKNIVLLTKLCFAVTIKWLSDFLCDFFATIVNPQCDSSH